MNCDPKGVIEKIKKIDLQEYDFTNCDEMHKAFSLCLNGYEPYEESDKDLLLVEDEHCSNGSVKYRIKAHHQGAFDIYVTYYGDEPVRVWATHDMVDGVVR